MKSSGPRRAVDRLEFLAVPLGFAVLFLYSSRPGVFVLPAAVALSALLLSERWFVRRARAFAGTRAGAAFAGWRLLLCAALFFFADPFTTPVLLTAILPGLFMAARAPSPWRLVAAPGIPLLATIPALLMPLVSFVDIAGALLGPIVLTTVGVVIVAHSLTERHEARQLVERQLRLQERQARERGVLDALDEPVLLLDRDFRVAGANPRAAEVMGDDLIGRFLTEMVRTPEGHDPVPGAGTPPGPGGFHAVEAYLAAGPGRGARWSLDLRQLPLDPSASSRWVAVLHRSVRMLEQVRLGEDRYRRQQQATRRRNQFLRLMSYELRSPLNAILGFGELLQMPEFGHLNEIQASRVDVTSRMGRHLSGILDSVREFVRLGEQPPPVREPFDLSMTAEEVARLVANAAETKGMVLELSLPGEPIAALGDRQMTTQAMLNLMTNAIRFTSEGGVIRLSVCRAGELVEAVVEDTGSGIPRSEQAQVFEPFDGSSPAGERGGGMGLAIARRLVELQGGSIALRSRPGQGSTFVVRLTGCSAEHAPDTFGDSSLLAQREG